MKVLDRRKMIFVNGVLLPGVLLLAISLRKGHRRLAWGNGIVLAVMLLPIPMRLRIPITLLMSDDACMMQPSAMMVC